MSRRPAPWLLVVGVCILALAGCGAKGPNVEGSYVHPEVDWRFELHKGRFVVYAFGEKGPEATYKVENNKLIIEWLAGGREEFQITADGSLYGPMQHPADRRITYKKGE